MLEFLFSFKDVLIYKKREPEHDSGMCSARNQTQDLQVSTAAPQATKPVIINIEIKGIVQSVY